VPANRRTRQNYFGRVRLWWKTHAQLSVGQHKAKARRMVPKKVSSALDLLECHVERQRVAGKNDLLD